MSEVKKYSHNIVHKPGDEGSVPDIEAQADCPNEDAPLGGSHEHIQRPGNEGSELGKGGMLADNQQGYQNVPPAPLSDWLQGPEVRRTYVHPASGADPTPEMPGAK